MDAQHKPPSKAWAVILHGIQKIVFKSLILPLKTLLSIWNQTLLNLKKKHGTLPQAFPKISVFTYHTIVTASTFLDKLRVWGKFLDNFTQVSIYSTHQKHVPALANVPPI